MFFPVLTQQHQPEMKLKGKELPYNPYRFTPRSDSVKFSGASLTTEEKELLQNLPTGQDLAKLVIITDPGFDVDDETALVVAAALQKRGLVDVKAVVTTTVPSQERGLLAKGVLKELGLGNVPVGIGNNHTPVQFSPESHRLKADFIATDSEIEKNAQVLLKKTMEAADNNSLTILVIANMSDVTDFLKSNEALFKQKVKNVVVMGGIHQNSENEDQDLQGIKLNTEGFMSANTIATNNRHHQESADFLYTKVQQLDIPIKVVTRKAATNTPIQPNFFQDLRETGHSVAKHIHGIEGDFLNKFWQAAYKEQMGPGRDKSWFKAAFCLPNTPNTLTEQDDIRPYLKSRVLYDAIALLACVEGLANQLFVPVKVKTQNTVHQIIGLSDKMTGLLNPEKLATLLSALSKDALEQR